MAKHRPFLLLFFFLSFDLAAQTVDTFMVSNHYVRNFLDNIKSKDIGKGMIWLCDKPYILNQQNIFDIAASANMFLSEQDKCFIKQQVDQIKDILWTKSLIDSSIFLSQNNINTIFKIRNKEAAWDDFRKKYNNSFYKISYPIFTKDMQFCFIQIDKFCGTLCGTYVVNIYKREGTKWLLYKNVDYSVS